MTDHCSDGYTGYKAYYVGPDGAQMWKNLALAHGDVVPDPTGQMGQDNPLFEVVGHEPEPAPEPKSEKRQGPKGKE